MAAAFDATLCPFGKEPFHQVAPTAAGGRAVHMKAAMADEPAADLVHFVVAIVIQDHMHLEVLGHTVVDLPEEAQELLVAVLPTAVADDDPASHIEGGKERGGAVPFVVVRLPLRNTRR